MDEYIKDYDKWSTVKKMTDEKAMPEDFFFLEGEVWWTALGVNIGHEIDGKNELFERPVVILKKLNEDLLWILPITTTERDGEYFHKITHKGRLYTILLQIRTISNKRLLRLAYRISNDDFMTIREKIHVILGSIRTIPSG
jgi:mRNA-degrading endonuclease toxin of MazEF toxin-antitoxin module